MPMPRLTVKPSRSSLTARRMIPSRVSMGPSCLPHRAPLDPLFAGQDHEAVYEHSRRVNALGIHVAHLDELLDLGDRDLAGGHGHGIEVAGRLSVHEVAEPVAFPGGDHRKVAHDPALEEVVAPV